MIAPPESITSGHIELDDFNLITFMFNSLVVGDHSIPIHFGRSLLSVSSLPKGDLFILDEPGTALDEENMEGFIRILELIKTYFKTVLLISHLDSLKDCVDTQITIDKTSGYAHVNQ